MTPLSNLHVPHQIRGIAATTNLTRLTYAPTHLVHIAHGAVLHHVAQVEGQRQGLEDITTPLVAEPHQITILVPVTTRERHMLGQTLLRGQPRLRESVRQRDREGIMKIPARAACGALELWWGCCWRWWALEGV